MFRYLLYKLGQFCVHRLSLKTAYAIGIFLSDLHFFMSFRDRRAVKNNLKIILRSEDNLHALAREVFRNFGKYLVDFFRMKKTLNEEYIKKNIKIKNVERLYEALKNKNGGIIITAHIGNWELGAAVMSILGHRVVAIALPHKERPVNDLFNNQREAWGMSIVPTSAAIRRCLEALKENRLIALLADRDFTQNGEEMDFLGKKALIPKGAAIFASKTGAPIIPIFLLRNPDDSFTLEFESVIYPPAAGKEDVPHDVLLTIMHQYTTVIEEKIRQYPTQWLMFREFWTK